MIDMKEPYLEVTFRHGRLVAAYLYLPRSRGEKSCRTSKAEPGMVGHGLADGALHGAHHSACGVSLVRQRLEDRARHNPVMAETADRALAFLQCLVINAGRRRPAIS